MVQIKPSFIKNKRQLRTSVADFLFSQINELCEIRNPRLRDTPLALEDKKKLFLKKFENKSTYCLLPWREKTIRILEKKLYRELRTARNKNLITSIEQTAFSNAKIAVAGLSVGSNIARLCLLQGGGYSMNLADADTVGPTNLNRILAGIQDVGRKKTTVLAENLYEIDPFINLRLFNDGVTPKNIEKFINIEGGKATVIIEEVDNLEIKILLRKLAEKYRIPLVSIADDSDGIIIDVERYDKKYRFADFAKRLAVLRGVKGKSMSIQEKARAITNFIGKDFVSKKMLQSIPEVGSTLFSWPQLGGAALLAGVAGSYCVRKIACGQKLESGRYLLSLDTVFSKQIKIFK